jgi:hypothetical protein
MSDFIKTKHPKEGGKQGTKGKDPSCPGRKTKMVNKVGK